MALARGKSFPQGAASRREQSRQNRGVCSVIARASNEASVDVVIAGAGLAGLNCARQLRKKGLSVKIYEASSRVGGRVKTDMHPDGYLLDHGFQILLSAYPECRRELDYRNLDLKPFYNGALVRINEGWHRVADPFRHPLDAVRTLLNPVGTPLDKLLVLWARAIAIVNYNSGLPQGETTILDRLRSQGFSERMINAFFSPFFGGIFFDSSLGISSRLYDFVMTMLALGENCLPSGGIGEIPEQISSSLPIGSISFNCPVQCAGPNRLVLNDGVEMRPNLGTVVATEQPEAERILAGKFESQNGAPGQSVTVYFAASSVPMQENVLLLNAERGGLINNACFPSNVAATYAPPGRGLVAATVLGIPSVQEGELVRRVRQELEEWFGRDIVSEWRFLRAYYFPFGHPPQQPPMPMEKSTRLEQGLYICGDHRESATFDGAMRSGRRAAEALLEDCELW